MKVWRTFAAALLAMMPACAIAHLFHTGAEPPVTQLSRDYVVIRILLKDPRDYFEQIRGVYDGTIKVPAPVRSRAWLAKRPEHVMVFRGAEQRAWTSGTLRREVERIDRTRGLSLGLPIDRALAQRDRDAVESAFRDMFTVLVSELLGGIAERSEDTSTAHRLYQRAQRYYSEALEAYLVLHAPAASSLAGLALEGMGRSLGNTKTGAPPAPEAFERHRRRFMRAVMGGSSE
jgi:hypothetical protein